MRRINISFVLAMIFMTIVIIASSVSCTNDIVNAKVTEEEMNEAEEDCVPPDDLNWDRLHDQFGSFKIGLNPDRNYLILVNDDHPYKFGGKYDKILQRDLIYVSDTDGVPTPIEKGANLAFSQLKQYLASEYGLGIELYSAYRTKKDQQWVCDNFDTEDDTGTRQVMEPGYSEHHTGLLLHFKIYWPDEEDEENCWRDADITWEDTDPDFGLVRENLANFGFIERYPAGKGKITGIAYEPYEIRFVGSSRIAHEIMDNDLCLEEYLEMYK